MENSREIYVKKILEAIPRNIKPVDYLMDVLEISRESVYRRLRCQVSFSFDEMAKLSSELNLSLDEIVSANIRDRAIFMHRENLELDPMNYLLSFLDIYHINMEEEIKVGKRRAIISINNLWLPFTVANENLFKFYYYKWMCHIYSTSPNYSFADVTFPEPIVELKKKIGPMQELLNNSVFIIDKLVYFNVMKDIQYYYRRKLVTKQELLLLKEDMTQIIDYTRKQLTMSVNKWGAAQYIYLSNINIYSNSVYLEYDDKQKSIFYIYNMCPITTHDPNICQSHKQWLEALRKYSVMMSISNEELQVAFFNRQEKYLENLANDVSLVP